MSRPVRIDFGVSQASFRDEIFEQRPYVKHGAFSAEQFGWALIDGALAHHNPGRSSLKVLKGGRVDPDLYTEDYVDIGIVRNRIRKDKLYALVGSGATLVLNRIELSCADAQEICHQVGRFIGAQATANAYASLGSEAATNVHWDTHDVVIVQLYGAKRWRVFAPTFELPISSQTSNNHRTDAPSEVWLEQTLEAGDMLYLPRGWWHKVEPLEGRQTIHLTVAVHLPLALDYVIWACAHLLPSHLACRRALLGRVSDGDVVAEVSEIVGRALMEPAHRAAFMERCALRDRVMTPFQIGRLFSGTSDSLRSGTRVRLNSRCASDRFVPSVMNGSETELAEARFQSAIRFMAANVDVTVGDVAEAIEENIDATRGIIRSLVLADVAQVLDWPSAALVPHD